MPVEEITLMAGFKVDLADVDESAISEIHRLFSEYKRIVNELIEYAHSHGTTSYLRLWYAKYHELRQRYPTLPSHYIYTACRCAASIYKPFMELKRLGMCEKERPAFKGRAIWLDRPLFRLDAENRRASIVLHGGRWVTLRLLHGRYHDKFKGMRVLVMEDLKVYKEDKGSRELNGRLHRWSYRRFQRILEYQAKLHGINVKYVDPAYTSSICPICRGELSQSPNGCRLMKCWRCGLEEDRDVIAVKNLVKRYYEEVMNAKTS